MGISIWQCLYIENFPNMPQLYGDVTITGCVDGFPFDSFASQVMSRQSKWYVHLIQHEYLTNLLSCKAVLKPLWPISLRNLTQASLAKPPLKFNGDLAKLGLSSFVKYATGWQEI